MEMDNPDTQKCSRDWYSPPVVYIKSFYGISTWLTPGFMVVTRVFPCVPGNPLQWPCLRNVTPSPLGTGCRRSAGDDTPAVPSRRWYGKQEPVPGITQPGRAAAQPQGKRTVPQFEMCLHSCLLCPRRSGFAALGAKYGLTRICHRYRLKERSRRFTFP